MFTGLVEGMGTVAAAEPCPAGMRLQVDVGNLAQGVKLGDSISINGCCLTVVALQGPILGFDAVPETLQRTNLGRLVPGDAVNLERSLKVGDRLGGHFVTGHIDGQGWVERREEGHEWSYFWFSCSETLTRQMASKGSIAVDGVSLTLVAVESTRFSVALIPHTLSVTTLGRRAVGDPVNLETDLLAKYVARLYESLPAGGAGQAGTAGA